MIHYSLKKKKKNIIYFFFNWLAQVDTESGEITLRKTLDHETQAEFSFLVIARDGGMPAHSATATVTVKVKMSFLWWEGGGGGGGGKVVEGERVLLFKVNCFCEYSKLAANKIMLSILKY